MKPERPPDLPWYQRAAPWVFFFVIPFGGVVLSILHHVQGD